MSNDSENRIAMKTIVKVLHVYGTEPAGIMLQLTTNDGEVIDIFLSRPSQRRRGKSCKPRSTISAAPEHFQEKWKPVFRPKMRQCKNASEASPRTDESCRVPLP